MLPADLRDRVEATNLLVARGVTTPASIDASHIRLATRNEHKLGLWIAGEIAPPSRPEV
ncbi:MAG: hypothetical protein MO852_13770 [Candidatus Devosia euplotis]|nr:hypothetical protein [Candidatus Devosia euplotis]